MPQLDLFPVPQELPCDCSSMHVERQADGWHVVAIPDTVTDCGPWSTKAEATEALRGLKRFFEKECKQ